MSGHSCQGTFRMLWVLNSVFSAASFLGGERPLDVCTAAKAASSRKGATVLVRGTGQVLDDGLALASISCPIVKTVYDQLPTVILVKVTSFATLDARSRCFRAESEKGRASPTLDVEVRGKLICRARVRFIRSGPDIVGGNGLGTLGLYKCTLNSARLMQIADSKVQTGAKFPSKTKIGGNGRPARRWCGTTSGCFSLRSAGSGGTWGRAAGSEPAGDSSAKRYRRAAEFLSSEPRRQSARRRQSCLARAGLRISRFVRPYRDQAIGRGDSIGRIEAVAFNHENRRVECYRSALPRSSIARRAARHASRAHRKAMPTL